MSRVLIDPGRAFKRAGTNLRSGVETTDWHELEKHRFASGVADAMEHLVRARHVKALVIAAPPRTLADLRQALHADVKDRVVAGIAKDLTKHPLAEIEAYRSGKLNTASPSGSCELFARSFQVAGFHRDDVTRAIAALCSLAAIILAVI